MSNFKIVIKSDKNSTPQEGGDFFEKVVGGIFKNQRYKIKERVNFTGSEIDLILTHKDTNVGAYVECKAKENLESSEIEKFVFNIQFRKKEFGFFIYTKDFQHQVGGLIDEITNDPEARYSNIHFWNADKVIELLVDGNEIVEFSLPKSRVKYGFQSVVFLYSYFGKFYIPLLTKNTIPEFFSIFDATNMISVTDQATISLVKKNVGETNGLNFVDFKRKLQPAELIDQKLDIIAETQESESWDDLIPASSKYFIGRKNLINEIIEFFGKVIDDQSNKRIFYLDGNSGWGKSSIVNQLRSKSRNIRYRNKLFVFALDSRSANTSNYVALSFVKMLQKAVKSKFLPGRFGKFKINSNLDILGSKDKEDLISYLKEQKKVLVIVFDQFEDVFRKEHLFRVFHKFMLDVNSVSSNIIVGFSWKSEINIPISHEAYYLWQQMGDYANKYSVSEFTTSECLQIVAQLKKALKKKLSNEFSVKIAQTSQGFPWLVKKLCVHISKELNNGLDEEQLFESDFNTKSLFEKDLSELSKEEIRALRYIAKRSFENNAFDITEIDESISDELLKELIHKRFVIKSGGKYNIYWDIFRDYLVTGEIPQIGDTYFVKAQSVETLLNIFLLFKDEKFLTFEKLSSMIKKSGERNNNEGTTKNFLTDLRKIGLISLERGKYLIRPGVEVSESFFKNNLRQKLLKHTFYLEILSSDKEEIDIGVVEEIIKRKFKGSDKLSGKTISIYAKVFLAWLVYSGISIPKLSTNLKSYTRNILGFTPQNQPKIIIPYLLNISENSFLEEEDKGKILYDLKYFGFLTYHKEKSSFHCDLTEVGAGLLNSSNKELLIAQIIIKSESIDKIRYAYERVLLKPKISSSELKMEMTDLLSSINSNIYKNKTSRVLYEWAMFLFKTLNNGFPHKHGDHVPPQSE